MVILGKKTDLDTIKQTLSDEIGFVSMLRDHDPDKTQDQIWDHIFIKYIDKPGFSLFNYNGFSFAESALSAWCNALE